MRGLGRIVTIAAMLISVAGMARAAEIRVLAVRAPEVALRNLAADFAKESGHQVVFTIGSPAVVMEKIKANEVHDAVIVSEPAMDQLDKEGIVNPESRVRLANTGIGVVVREGAAVPDLATPEAFKQALMAAKSIVYGDVFPNQSGEKVEKILAALGILDALRPKIRIVSGHRNSQPLIAKGEVEMGLYNLSEIHEGTGVKLAGPVPAPLQLVTIFEGALMSDGSVPEAARAYIRFLASADARDKWVAAKLEPLGEQ
jgi:molybdate transport system substrate-binding protein